MTKTSHAWPNGSTRTQNQARSDGPMAVTVWSAGPGKPGLLEPMGVDSEHRGHGFGKAITLAATAALQELASSSAIV